jgi:triphosphatase
LARRGIALRVRQKNGHFVQTVKSDDRAGPGGITRGEWEDAIATGNPDPSATVTGRFLTPEVADQLVPLFRSEIVRRTVVLSATGGTCIEAAIDQGRVYAPRQRAADPISEIELELKEGAAGEIYDVALDLLATAPLRLECCSKAERGYRLAAPEAAPIAAVHATAIELDGGMSGHAALQRIGFSCLDQILRNQAAVLAGLGEGIHQMRVGIRRLRAILSTFGPMLPDEQRRWAAEELRWLGSALGAARNLDVFEAEITSTTTGDDAVVALIAAAEKQRKVAYRQAAKAICSARYARALLRLLRWFETQGWREADGADKLAAPIGGISAQMLDRRYRVARRRSRDFARQSFPQRHRLRIALKKLRYASEGLGLLYDASALERYLKPLKRLQDDLGDANDMRVGRDITAALAQSGADGGAIAEVGAAIFDRHQRELAEHEPKLREHLAAMLATEPFWARASSPSVDVAVSGPAAP